MSPSHAARSGARIPVGSQVRPDLVTRVDAPTAVPWPELYRQITATRETHASTLHAFHTVWYDAKHTWATGNFLGVPMMKNPMDLWAYHELLCELRPTTVLETGTFAGGSALWFAFLMDVLGIRGGRILTIDIDDYLDRRPPHPRVTYYAGDATDATMIRTVTTEVTHPLVITLDADHSTAHVRKELDAYAPLLRVGEYVVVEDTNISWPMERGAAGAVQDYADAHPGEFVQDIWYERMLLTMHPGGWLKRVAPCTHQPSV